MTQSLAKMWMHRPMEREWTAKERLGIAQKKSAVQRPPAKITLPQMPWQQQPVQEYTEN